MKMISGFTLIQKDKMLDKDFGTWWELKAQVDAQ